MPRAYSITIYFSHISIYILCSFFPSTHKTQWESNDHLRENLEILLHPPGSIGGLIHYMQAARTHTHTHTQTHSNTRARTHARTWLLKLSRRTQVQNVAFEVPALVNVKITAKQNYYRPLTCLLLTADSSV